MRHPLSVALLVVAAVVGGGCCSTAPKQAAASVSADPQADNRLLLLGESDRMLPGEALEIFIEENPPTVPSSLKIDRTVQADGTVALVSNKVFRSAGKTLGEFRREVRDPGRLLYEGPATLRKAILSRGGFTPCANKKKVQLIRRDGERRIVNCSETQWHPEEDMKVWPGDHIYVPRSSKWLFW